MLGCQEETWIRVSAPRRPTLGELNCERIASARIEPGGHPVLRAHAQAATASIDVNENLCRVKDRNRDRIDGIAALIMANSRTKVQ